MNTKFLILFSIVISSVSRQSLAQQSEIDSLKNVLQITAQDTHRVSVLLALSDASVENTEVLGYAEEALQLAKKLKDSRGIAYAMLNIG